MSGGGMPLQQGSRRPKQTPAVMNSRRCNLGPPAKINRPTD